MCQHSRATVALSNKEVYSVVVVPVVVVVLPLVAWNLSNPCEGKRGKGAT